MDQHMKRLIQDQIIRSTIIPLTENDKIFLRDKKNNLLFAAVCIYIVIAGFCLFFWTRKSQLLDLNNKSFRVNFNNGETDRLKEGIPYICALIFLVCTFFVIKIFIQSIVPMIRDLKKGKKSMLYFVPHKSPISSSNTYFLSLPIYGYPTIEVGAEDFGNPNNKEEFCVEMAPQSAILLQLNKNGKSIKYK